MNERDFFVDENGCSIFEVPRQQKLVMNFGNAVVLPSAIIVNEKIDYKKMEKCIQHAFDIYDAMRFIAYKKDDFLGYRILNQYHYKLKVYEAKGAAHDARYKDAISHMNKQLDIGMNIFSDISIRIELVKIEEAQYVLFFVCCPWIMDGTSTSTVSNMILSEYNDEPLDIPESIQYHEFIKWYLDFEKSEKGIAEKQFWESYMKGYTKFDSSKMFEGTPSELSDYNAQIPEEYFERATKVYNTSLMNIFIFAYHLTITFFFSEPDTVISVPFACRGKKEHFYIVGNLTRNFYHRLIVEEKATLSETVRASIDSMSKAIINHHISNPDINLLTFASNHNNFRNANYVSTHKNISQELGRKDRGFNGWYLTLLKFPDKMSLFYMCGSHVTKECIQYFNRNIPLIVQYLMTNPDMTVGTLKEIILENEK